MHEKLTHELAAKAWGIFQMMQAKEDPLGWLEDEIALTAKTRDKKINNNEIRLIGVNQFAKPDVRKADVRKSTPLKSRSGDLISATTFTDAVEQAGNGHLTSTRKAQTRFKQIRLSEKFDIAGGA